MGALFDVPTLALYFLAARLGAPARVTGAADPVYFVIGCVVWFAGGVLLVLLLRLFLRGQKPPAAQV